VKNLQTALEADVLATWSQWGGRWRTVPFAGASVPAFLYVGKNAQIKISPIPLDRHEAQFVQDLAAVVWSHVGREVYLLRNQAVTGWASSRRRTSSQISCSGCRMAEKQASGVVDPKGLLHFDPADPKIQFATRDIPRLQQIIDAQASDLTLHAFILSNTPMAGLGWSRGSGNLMSKIEIEALGVLSQPMIPRPTSRPSCSGLWPRRRTNGCTSMIGLTEL